MGAPSTHTSADASEQEYNTSRKRILHPKDISDSFSANSPSSTINVLSSRPRTPSLLAEPPSRTTSSRSPLAPKMANLVETPRSGIDKYSEADSEDYSDVFGSTGVVERGASKLGELLGKLLMPQAQILIICS